MSELFQTLKRVLISLLVLGFLQIYFAIVAMRVCGNLTTKTKRFSIYSMLFFCLHFETRFSVQVFDFFFLLMFFVFNQRTKNVAKKKKVHGKRKSACKQN